MEESLRESARIARNQQRLTECHPKFAKRLAGTIASLEARGFRPRIQDAWRSKADQLKAFKAGNSQVTFGFHNATGPSGEKMALAVDMLDDDNPLNPPTRYLLALAIAARAEGLDTGILWRRAGQPPLTAAAKAIADGNIDARVNVGWDPCHVEVVGVTLAEAEAGNFKHVT